MLVLDVAGRERLALDCLRVSAKRLAREAASGSTNSGQAKGSRSQGGNGTMAPGGGLLPAIME